MMTRRQTSYLAIAISSATAAIPVVALDSNTVARLESLDMCIRAELHDYHVRQTELSAELDEFRTDREMYSELIASWESRLRSARHRSLSTVSSLWSKRNAVLEKAGLPRGQCEIHGVRIVPGTLGISYGLPRAFSEGYEEARLKLFRNSGTPISGGCVVSPESPKTMRVLHCPECDKARAEWTSSDRYPIPSASNKPIQETPGGAPDG